MSVIAKAMEKARLEHEEAARTERGAAPALYPPQAAQTGPARYSENLVTADPMNSNTGGEYRLLKGQILALHRENPALNLFMVTSAMRNEGKTLVSCNLAASLAHEFDTTVLLVDADLRAPKCHHMLGLPEAGGLSDCLRHGTPLAEVLIHTGIGRLTLLGAGEPVTNPTELFTSNRLRNLLREIKNRYSDRIVIIDTSPILPFAETRALSRVVDGILLVVRENVTAKVHFESTLRSLEGLPFFGVVYNDAGSFGSDKELFEFPYVY